MGVGTGGAGGLRPPSQKYGGAPPPHYSRLKTLFFFFFFCLSPRRSTDGTHVPLPTQLTLMALWKKKVSESPPPPPPPPLISFFGTCATFDASDFQGVYFRPPHFKKASYALGDRRYMLSTEKPLKEKTIATSTTFYTFHFFLYNINFSFVWNKKK